MLGLLTESDEAELGDDADIVLVLELLELELLKSTSSAAKSTPVISPVATLSGILRVALLSQTPEARL